MPRYRLIEKRSYRERVLIDAENEEAAKMGHGEIIDEATEESWSDEFVDIEEVDADEDEA